MPQNLLRLAYITELLLAWIAYLQVWIQVGGQGHLDLIPWYMKFGLILGLSLVTVLGTAAAVSHERAWNAKSIASLILILLLVLAVGGTTYYYHLHENDEVPATEGISPLAFGMRRLAA